jgi:antitoxin (DNA-binding transcriptional repressor) of toxin-antitoxin stability system
MKTLAAEDATTQFSSLLKEVESGEEIAISYGHDAETIAVLVPYGAWKRSRPRVLGSLVGKMSVDFADDWHMTDEELLRS